VILLTPKTRAFSVKYRGLRTRLVNPILWNALHYWGICGFVEVLTYKCLRQGKELYIIAVYLVSARESDM
jgi:hypothetical protein